MQGRKIYCRHLGLQSPAFPIFSHHTCHSRWAISSCLCTGNPKHASSSRMVPPRKGGPECRNTMPPSEISQAETQQLVSSHASPPNSAYFFHGALGLPCADTTTDKFRLKKSIQHFQEASRNYARSAGRCGASPCTTAPSAFIGWPAASHSKV